MEENKTDRPKVKIRRLKVKDLYRITDLLEKGVEEIGEESLRDLISSQKTVNTGTSSVEPNNSVEESIGETVVTIGTAILRKMNIYFKTDIAELFADLLECTLEEYLDMDIDTPIIVIDLIRSAPQVEGFFMMSSLVSKMTPMLEKPLAIIKTQFDSIYAEARKDS